ncbi:hypothetical protein N9Q11_03300 [Acidimicrobiia bacterium]|jgi:hypothetical protein|nr:hypothetical protein [Acidimicrobiia bacterium]MDA9646100.1 hypothetical protein [Candidatus Actinomarina sp.]
MMSNKKYLVVFLLFAFCSDLESSSEEKIDDCIQLADEIERVFDEIQIEAYESEIYRTYSYIDATKLDYVNEALRINKIGLDGLDSVIANYEIKNLDLESVIDGFYNNFLDSKNANTALEKHLISINNIWTIQDEVQWWDDNQDYSIKYWRTSDEYRDLLSSKSQNTLTPDPDFVVSDNYPQGVLRKYCGTL